jgi:hypothetical protein
MAEQNRPASKALAPDPSNNYERSHPENEAGQGRLDNNSKATPTAKPDKIAASVGNAQDGSKQINAHDATTGTGVQQPDHSMLEEEPLGWDQTSSSATSDQTRRHPRTGGKGGTPNAGEPTKKG